MNWKARMACDLA